ncbi:hypothetical protein N7461_002076 [Penicillium sp. DV-2018c]|nr:hypothetical protein N7461_002076 [Penicillium sp. DV-2018c]
MSSLEYISHPPAEHTRPWPMLPPPAGNRAFHNIEEAINWINDWGERQGNHNHPGSPPEELFAHRRTSPEAFGTNLSSLGLGLSEARRKAKCATAEDIENANQRWEKDKLGDRTAFQALLDELPRDGTWFIRFSTDESGRLDMLFLVHKSSLRLLKSHPYLLWMDCTPTTKFYPVPLFHIVGVAANNKSFTAGFAFMATETTEVYISVLECLKEVYQSFHTGSDPIMEAEASSTLDPTHDQHNIGPVTVITDRHQTLLDALGQVFPRTNSMIDLRQILNDVQKHAKPAIRKYVQRYSGQPKGQALQAEIKEQWDIMKAKWCHLVSAYDDVDTLWSSFKEDYGDPIFENFITYLESEWLSEVSGCPRSFLRYHTKHYLHLDETTTFRVKVAHSILRRDAQSPDFDLFTITTEFGAGPGWFKFFEVLSVWLRWKQSIELWRYIRSIARRMQ